MTTTTFTAFLSARDPASTKTRCVTGHKHAHTRIPYEAVAAPFFNPVLAFSPSHARRPRVPFPLQLLSLAFNDDTEALTSVVYAYPQGEIRQAQGQHMTRGSAI